MPYLYNRIFELTRAVESNDLAVVRQYATFFENTRLMGDYFGSRCDTRMGHEIDEWFHQYVDDVHNYLVYFTGNLDVEDLVQDTFINAIKGLSHFKGTAHPKTWLLAIARNVAIDHIRSKRNTQLLPTKNLENIPTRQFQPDRAAEIHETRETLLLLIQQMKREYREVVLHRLVIGLSITETAETLCWSESKVKTTLHRALKQLRKSLGEVGEGGLTYDCI